MKQLSEAAEESSNGQSSNILISVPHLILENAESRRFLSCTGKKKGGSFLKRTHKEANAVITSFVSVPRHLSLLWEHTAAFRFKHKLGAHNNQDVSQIDFYLACFIYSLLSLLFCYSFRSCFHFTEVTQSVLKSLAVRIRLTPDAEDIFSSSILLQINFIYSL